MTYTEKVIQKMIEGGWSELPLKNTRINSIEVENDRVFVNFYDLQSSQSDHFCYFIGQIFLDPEAWRALGKAMGWTTTCKYCGSTKIDGHKDPNTADGYGEYHVNCSGCGIEWIDGSEFPEGNAVNGWLYHWHKLLDHLFAGGTIDSYCKELIENV